MTQRLAADQAMLEHLTALTNAVTRQTHAVGELRGLTLNDVLLDELVVLDAQGQAERSWSASAAYIGVWAYGSDITVTTGPAQGADAPLSGTGVKFVPGGLAMGWAFAGLTATIYGTPGDRVLLTAWSRMLAPFVAAAGDIIGGGA